MKNLKFSPKEQDQAHQLKILPKYYMRALTDEKPWELRKNDRDFQVGDFVTLNEWDPEEKKFTGSCIDGKITYVFLHQNTD